MLELTKDTETLQKYLKEKSWLRADEEIISVEKPGDGNMNFTLRVNTGNRTFIIKQSRAYVEKYPQVPAPATRMLQEAEFYKFTSVEPKLKSMMPDLLHVDEQNYVLAFEDLGRGADFSYIYKNGETISENELFEIMDFAAHLHKNINTETTEQKIVNTEMLKLNHEYIFQYPYMLENGLDLDTVISGLKEVSLPYKNDEKLKENLKIFGAMYLQGGNVLVHGDYFPGSWLKTNDGVKIIDPEFCFFGFPEFEIGVTIAHLKMADQPQELIAKAISYYCETAELDAALREKFTAVEVLRRILGLAQLPLEIDLEKRKQLLEEARHIILN